MKTILAVMLFASTSLAIEIDIEKSKVQWFGSKLTGTHDGLIGLRSAKIEVADSGFTGVFVIDMNQITVRNLKGIMKKKLENHLKSEDFFNAKKFPTSTLKVTGTKSGKAFGELSIKGRTKSIIIEFKKEEEVYHGSFAFDRTEFGVKHLSGKFFKDLGDKLVNDKIKIEFKILTKDAPKNAEQPVL